jgi:[ribosomal protein S18]-alanine N-acetyltransferase
MSSAAIQPQPVTLVRGMASDLADVMRVMASAFSADFGEGWSKSQCAGILPLGGVTLMLARDERGDTRGFSLARTVADEAELLLLAVEQGAQGEGYGAALLREFIDRGREQGHALLHLEVRDGNPAAAMYSKAGFHPVGRRKDYYRGTGGRKYDAVTMALNLR